MSELEKEIIVKLSKKAIEDTNKMFAEKSHSDAYIIGALQGTIKGIVNHLEK